MNVKYNLPVCEHASNRYIFLLTTTFLLAKFMSKLQVQSELRKSTESLLSNRLFPHLVINRLVFLIPFLGYGLTFVDVTEVLLMGADVKMNVNKSR